jgi:hypothetical protein
MSHLSFLFAPEGRLTVAQGVSPGKRSPNSPSAPEGRKNLGRRLSIAPPGLLELRVPPPVPRLAPWATSLRPSGALFRIKSNELQLGITPTDGS